MDTMKIDLDTLRQDHWSETEQRNVELITGFVQLLMNEHDFAAVRERYGNPGYTQHNRSLPDGVDGVTAYIAGITKRFPGYGYDVKRIYADGDHVIFHSHVTLRQADRGNERRGLIITDTWRVADGVIAEHWDAIQPLEGLLRFVALLTGGRIRNSNGLF